MRSDGFIEYIIDPWNMNDLSGFIFYIAFFIVRLYHLEKFNIIIDYDL